MAGDLPGPDFWALIRPHTGEVTDVRPTEYRSDLTAAVECETGRFFVKAMRNRPGGRRDQMLRERSINPFVRPIAPALLWAAEDEDWIVLGFEFVRARKAEFHPDSPDLPAVVALLNRIGEMALPEVAHDWRESRWDRFADEGAPSLFRGDALLHADINPSNLLVGSHGMWAVDWAWPTRGAAFIDPAMLVVQLISAGHSAESAEAWTAGCKAWANADPKAIDAFAVATVRMWREVADRWPDGSWTRVIVSAAEAWAAHRGVVVA
ncbi:hypothetical protein RM780_13220 [Streptomyces sp. DSM 44917]|uniref:Protein kinase n=1 Tax=Streptomyces boetiae TaxID=3075541 RepID=A0ABU2L8U2_9ACTN|nr:hypothetical protein [Streptomyces sp. DSM 44917]MDT0307917.1 hypothetical protein [Streptomyces sp. DSM 44917]